MDRLQSAAVPGIDLAGAVPDAGVRTPDDLIVALETDARLAGFALRGRGDDFVEVALGDGGLVFAWPELWRDRARLRPHLLRARAGGYPLVVLGNEGDLDDGVLSLTGEGDVLLLVLPAGRVRLAALLRNQREVQRLRRQAAEGELLSERTLTELDELNAIGRALSSQRNIDKLLALILEKSRGVTHADAGSVYVVDGEVLRFKVSQNDSVHTDFTELTLPVSPGSIVGRCVLSREVINIPDLYRLDQPGDGNNPWGFRHHRAFDDRTGYQTRSMLAVPMVDASDRVIGVIQLINRKRRPEHVLATPADFESKVMPFDARSQALAATLAAQAGVSLENTLLYDDISKLFEGFVHASVKAIESRDPTTSGHSQRVADLTIELARVTDRVETGPYAAYTVSDDSLRQIEYAALLHDFGKVGVREHVLVKARKLYDHDRDLVIARFDYIRKALDAERNERKLRTLVESDDREAALSKLDFIDEEYDARLAELEQHVQLVIKANEPSVLEQGGFERLSDLAQKTYLDPRGQAQPYLRQHEVKTLQILRGSLTLEERIEIESHVVHTYDFLKKIPWGRSFKEIPDIAGAHHEKLDGSGYPRRLKGDQIPIPARMMTIADIFDALTASDRPYKRAVPTDKALDIIASEVKSGRCDAELFRIFVEAKIFQIVLPKT